jgi:hypothetical protein
MAGLRRAQYWVCLSRHSELAKRYSIPGGTKWIAAASVLLVTVLLCRRITSIGWMGLVLCGNHHYCALVILAGLTLTLRCRKPPPGGVCARQKFATGLGGAMLIAIYDTSATSTSVSG